MLAVILPPTVLKPVSRSVSQPNGAIRPSHDQMTPLPDVPSEVCPCPW